VSEYLGRKDSDNLLRNNRGSQENSSPLAFVEGLFILNLLHKKKDF
jgi:hypothetical protein